MAVLTWEGTWLPVSPWRQGRAVLFVSWIPGASLVFGRLLVVLQVGPLFVLGTLAFQVLVFLEALWFQVVQEEDVLCPSSLQVPFAAEFVAC